MYWCPDCKQKLKEFVEGLACPKCSNVYMFRNGFCVFDNSKMVLDTNYGLGKLVLDIENDELISKLHRYLIPHIGDVKGKSILFVGCGGGGDIIELNRLGAEAYGMDFFYRTRYWKEKDYSNQILFVSSANKIPFPFEYFDIILCMGVIEHVAESLVSKKLIKELDRERQLFLTSLFKILKPRGYIIITTPNRNFPIDFQHGSYGILNWLSKFSIGIHSPFTRFLESYYSLSNHFKRIGSHKAEPMPLKNFFGFNVFKFSPQLKLFKKIFDFYLVTLDNMPNFIRCSFLNPYIVLKIIKV